MYLVFSCAYFLVGRGFLCILCPSVPSVFLSLPSLSLNPPFPDVLAFLAYPCLKDPDVPGILGSLLSPSRVSFYLWCHLVPGVIVCLKMFSWLSCPSVPGVLLSLVVSMYLLMLFYSLWCPSNTDVRISMVFVCTSFSLWHM